MFLEKRTHYIASPHFLSSLAQAIGAVAIGAFAIGALAIGRLAIRNARIKTLEIDELTVRKLNVNDEAAAAARERSPGGIDT